MNDRRSSIALNVAANWTWYVLVILSGFVLPRWIAQHQGRELLGVWDLGWSMLFYVDFLRMGISGATSRYVSRYRALGDWGSLNGCLNCSVFVLSTAALIGALVSLALCASAEHFVGSVSPETMAQARWVIFLLGCAAAIELPASAFNAVITGHERFDLWNWIRGGRDLLVLGTMLLLLTLGFGVVSLALTVLIGSIGCAGVAAVAARRLCPAIRIARRWITWKGMKEVFVFGGKSTAAGVARSLLYQINSILVAAYLGPAVLAVYARQRNLVMQVMKLVKQFAQVFIPVSSGMDARGDRVALQRLLIQSARTGLFITLPLMSALIILGGPLVQVWMGADYEAPWVLAVLAAGHLWPVAQLGPRSVLEGMGRHGRQALFELGGAIAGVAITWLGLGVWNWSIFGSAAVIAVCVTTFAGVLSPIHICRSVGLPFGDYIRAAVPGPLAAAAPWIGCLIAARCLFSDDPRWAVLVGPTVGGAVTALVYWVWLAPAATKDTLIEYVNRFGRRRRLGTARGVP